MAQPNVLRKVKVAGEWKFLPVSKVNGKLDWQHLDLHGVPVVSTEGTFYLDYREDGRRVRRAVGTHPRTAKAALASQSSILQLRGSGVEVDDAPEIQAYRPVSGKRISEVVSNFLAHPPVGLRKRSRAKYNNALSCFAAWTKKTHVSQLDRSDITGFMAHMVGVDGLDKSTAFNKGIVVHSVMNEHGATIKMKRGDWPRSTTKQPEVYEPVVLKKLFAAADPDEYALFQTFLLSGFRDQEVGFLAWDNFNPRKNTLSVTEKTAIGFAPKNYQERTIPVPDELVAILEAHRKRQRAGEYLIFPTSHHNTMQGRPGGQRDRHMLDTLKRLALRAGLNCGRCRSTYHGEPATCAEAPICAKFGLHKFRHTYATTLLRDGVDIVSLQKLLGHADLDSTRKYLRSLEPADLLAKIRGTSLATRFASV